MGAIGITPQISPIGWRRVGNHAAPPDDFFTANGEHRGDTARIGAVGINGEEALRCFNAVHGDRRRIGLVGTAESRNERLRISAIECLGGGGAPAVRSVMKNGPSSRDAYQGTAALCVAR